MRVPARVGVEQGMEWRPWGRGQAGRWAWMGGGRGAFVCVTRRDCNWLSLPHCVRPRGCTPRARALHAPGGLAVDLLAHCLLTDRPRSCRLAPKAAAAVLFFICCASNVSPYVLRPRPLRLGAARRPVRLPRQRPIPTGRRPAREICWYEMAGRGTEKRKETTRCRGRARLGVFPRPPTPRVRLPPSLRLLASAQYPALATPGVGK
jgi:hypothetical protein